MDFIVLTMDLRSWFSRALSLTRGLALIVTISIVTKEKRLMQEVMVSVELVVHSVHV